MSVIPFAPVPGAPPDAAQRQQALFDWAAKVLKELGFADAIANASTVQELNRIVFDKNSTEVLMAIHDALHPAHGKKADCFAGYSEATLKRILKNRFDDMVKDRKKALLNTGAAGAGAQYTPNWTDNLKTTDKGAVRPILANLILFLRHHPDWQNVLAFDEFASQVVIRNLPPWGPEAPDCPWTDHYEALTRSWFEQQDIFPNWGNVGRAVQTAARGNKYHPVRNQLDCLAWDGEERIDTWLPTFFNTEDTPYARAIGPRFLISAVARIYDPGCKVDHMLVLEGPQRKLKSQAVEALFAPWFTDQLSAIHSKDASIEISGVWAFEIAEMEILRKVSSGAKKVFLSRKVERFRPVHGKYAVKVPRQCVFIGSLNPPPGGKYLTDETGDRRLWPVACRGMVDLAGIKAHRDQIWAEAVARFKRGDPWWLETETLEALATDEQAARFVTDSWHDDVADFVGTRDVVCREEIMKALGVRGHSAEIRVAKILGRLNFEKHRGTHPGTGKRQNQYWRVKV
jgi:predicted P-loop ATPase